MRSRIFEQRYQRLLSLSEYEPWTRAFGHELKVLREHVSAMEVCSKRTGMLARLDEIESRQIRFLAFRVLPQLWPASVSQGAGIDHT